MSDSKQNILPDYAMAKQKIAALKVGDTILFRPPTPFSGKQFFSGNIEVIYRAPDGTRVFGIGDQFSLINQDRLLLPDWPVSGT